MRSLTRAAASLLLAAFVVGIGVTSAHAAAVDDGQQPCPPSTVGPEDVNGLNVDECALIGTTVRAGGVGAVIPDRGTTVTAIGEVTEGEPSYLAISVSESGEVTVSTTEPEILYGKILPDGSVLELTPPEATVAPLAYSRCNDWSYSLLSGNWRPSTLYLNSNERLPGNISKANFESITVASLNVWKNGTNSCGLSRALDVPGAISYGNWTYDANIASDNTCTTADGRNVIDFGPLSGNTLGLACTWYTSTGIPVQADVRFDNSARSWVTTTTGCSGTSYDLRSVVTHELGHVLGLGHSAENGGSDLTMSPNITNCNSSARTLGAGDLTGIYVKHGG
ncbi:matrixin family metalloprotease [Microbacterium aurum]